MVNQQIESNASHDFDVISHEGCSYDEPGKGLQVDVEKVVGKIFGTAEVLPDAVGKNNTFNHPGYCAFN